MQPVGVPAKKFAYMTKKQTNQQGKSKSRKSYMSISVCQLPHRSSLNYTVSPSCFGDFFNFLISFTYLILLTPSPRHIHLFSIIFVFNVS